jgi:hypothetical protein
MASDGDFEFAKRANLAELAISQKSKTRIIQKFID